MGQVNILGCFDSAHTDSVTSLNHLPLIYQQVVCVKTEVVI